MLVFRPSIYLSQHAECANPECGRCQLRERNAHAVFSLCSEPTQVVLPPYFYSKVNPHHAHIGPVHTGEVLLYAMYALEWFKAVFSPDREHVEYMRAVFPDRFNHEDFIEQRARGAEMFAPHYKAMETELRRLDGNAERTNLELVNCFERAILAGFGIITCLNERRPDDFVDAYVARHLSTRLVPWDHDRCDADRDSAVHEKARRWEAMRVEMQDRKLV